MARIVVLGSLNTDLVARVARLPAPGETVLAGAMHTFSGGKGGNQAAAAARLGGSVLMVGRVGADAFGEELLTSLRRDGVDTSGVGRDPEAPTGTAVILVDSRGENVIAVSPGANATLGEEEVERALDAVDRDGLLLLQLEIPAAAVRQAIEGARKRRLRVLLNAAPVREFDAAQVAGVDIVVANEPESSALVGRDVTGIESATDAARELHHRGVGLAVITLGAAGSVFCQDGRVERIQPFDVTAVDSTGAGDAFVGALAVVLTGNVELRQALRYANAAGAGAASQAGAQSSLPRRADLERLFGIRWP